LVFERSEQTLSFKASELRESGATAPRPSLSNAMKALVKRERMVIGVVNGGAQCVLHLWRPGVLAQCGHGLASNVAVRVVQSGD